MDELVKKIEATYDELIYTISKVNQLSETIDYLKLTTTQIIDKYTETLDHTKIDKAKQQTEKTLQIMVEDIKRIENLMNGVEVAKQDVKDLIGLFNNRMNSLEESLKNARKPIQDIDQKIVKYIKEAEKNAELGMKRFNQAAQLVDAKVEIQQYSELISLQKENNKLIKQLMAKLDAKLPEDKSILASLNQKNEPFKSTKIGKETILNDPNKKS